MPVGYPIALRYKETDLEKSLLDEPGLTGVPFSFRIGHAGSYRSAEGLFSASKTALINDLNTVSSVAAYRQYWESLGYDAMMLERHLDAIRNPKYLPRSLASNGEMELEMSPSSSVVRAGFTPIDGLQGQAAADWWNQIAINIRDYIHYTVGLTDGNNQFPFDTTWQRCFPLLYASVPAYNATKYFWLKNIAMEIDKYILSLVGIDPADCYMLTPVNDDATGRPDEYAEAGNGICIFSGYPFDTSPGWGIQRHVWAYRSDIADLLSWGFIAYKATTPFISSKVAIANRNGSGLSSDANGNVILQPNLYAQMFKLGLSVGASNVLYPTVADIAGPVVGTFSSNNLGSSPYRQYSVSDPNLTGLVAPDGGIPLVTYAKSEYMYGSFSNLPQGRWHAQALMYGDRNQYSSLSGFKPAQLTTVYSGPQWRQDGDVGTFVPYNVVTTDYYAVIWSRHVQKLSLSPTSVSMSTVDGRFCIEVDTDDIHMSVPMLYLKDYALQLKALDPTLASEVDKVILDMAGYEDAIISATLLGTPLNPPFEVLKSTEIYRISQEIGEDLYALNFTEGLTFKQAQNRINGLPPQSWWVKIWDDALVGVDLVSEALAPYLQAPSLYKVAQLVDDATFHIVSPLGTEVIAVSFIDAASLVINGLPLYNGDDVIYYGSEALTATIESFMGTDLNLSQLTIGGNLSGGDWTSFQADVFTDEYGYPQPANFSGDAAARMWMVFKGIDVSKLERILSSLHDLNPFLTSTQI